MIKGKMKSQWGVMENIFYFISYPTTLKSMKVRGLDVYNVCCISQIIYFLISFSDYNTYFKQIKYLPRY
jgi:hypothetical protein